MLRLTNNFYKLSLTETFYPVLYNVQSVRHRGKPLWFPTAKSKLFKIHPRIRLPKEEYEELKRLHNIYRTRVKSVRKFLQDEYEAQNIIEFDEEQHKRTIEEDYIKCSQINDEWNKKVKVEREAREKREFEKLIAQAEKRIEDGKLREKQRIEEADRLVREQIEASATFITPDKLDETIEYVLNNPVDYNYALDLQGNKIHGRETEPSVTINLEQDKKIRIKQ